MYHSGQTHSGVLLLRLESAIGEAKARVIEEIVHVHGDQLPGNFFVYQDGRLRIRP